MTFRIRVLGGLSLARHGAPVEGAASQRRNLAMLAVLAVRGRVGISRENLSALFWPESDETSARNSLKQTIFVLRRELGADAVLGATELRCGPQFPECDLAGFEAALARGDLESAVDLYTGVFLDGFHLSGGAESFERWVDAERTRLARRRDAALEALAVRAEGGGDRGTALRWWHQLSDAVPLDSRYALGRIRALLASGDRAGALKHAELHRKVLKEELGLPLDAAIEQLIGAARVDRVAPAAEWSAEKATAELPAVPELPPRTPRRARQLEEPMARPAWRRGAVLWGAALGLAAIVTLGWSLRTRSPRIDSRRVALVPLVRTEREASDERRAVALIEAIARHLIAVRLTPVVLPASDDASVPNVSHRAGARFAISVASVDSGRVEAALTDASSGERVWGIRATAGTAVAADVLAERAATAVAVRTDPLMATWIHATSEPTSIAAYRNLARGLAFLSENQVGLASERFLLAAGDTAFTLPLVLAGLASIQDGKPKVADSIAIAVRHRELSPLERALMQVQAARIGANLDAEFRAARAVAAAAPTSEWRYLLAEAALKLGRGNEATRVLESMGPDLGWMKGSPGYWGLLGRALHQDRAHARELVAVTEARRRFPTDRVMTQGYLKALAANGMVDAALAEVDRALTLRQRGLWGDHQPMSQAIAELRAHGYHEGARRVALRTLSWIAQLPADVQEEWAVMIPWYLYEAGDLAAAHEHLKRLAKRAPLDLDNVELLGVIAAKLGDRATAVRIRDANYTAAPDSAGRVDELVRRATIAASLGDFDQSVEYLRDAVRGGFAWRSVLHILPGFEALQGFPAFEALVHPQA